MSDYQLKFSSVEYDDMRDARIIRVTISGEEIGVLYREVGMNEWAPDAGLEARYGENCACGHTYGSKAEKELQARENLLWTRHRELTAELQELDSRLSV